MGRLTSISKISIPFAILAILTVCFNLAEADQWDFPFPTVSVAESKSDSLTLEMALSEVAQANRSLKAFDFSKTGAAGLIRQSGLRPNTELEFETEEFSGSLPGFSQAEWSLSLSQEFEFWGKRRARIKETEIEAESIHLEADIAAFDIYARVSRRFFELGHAQVKYDLLKQALKLAEELVEAARIRIEKGAAHISELNMAELELSRGKINLDNAEMELANARHALAALWDGSADQINSVKPAGGDITIPDIETLTKMVGDSREMARMEIEQARLKAATHAAIADARPSPTIRAGIKRLEAEDVNTFLVGVSLPLPFFNRNQGRQRALQSQASAIDLEMQQKRTETETELYTIYERLRRLETTGETLDRDLIPQAEATFQSLKEAFAKGKLPYLALLEGERTLLELQQEKNDTMLELRYQIILLEELLGIRLM